MNAIAPLRRALWLFSLLLTLWALALDWRRLHSDPPVVSRAVVTKQAPETATAAAEQTETVSPSEPSAPIALLVQPNALHVLFVGNGLTARNNMPEMVTQLAKAAREPRPFTWHAELQTAAKLHEHVAAGIVSKHIGGGSRWDAVVLQEQGQFSAFEEQVRKEDFFPSVRVLHQEIVWAGSKTILFVAFARREGDIENYPTDTYAAMQQRIVKNHARLAQELGAEQVPVGQIWQAMLKTRPALRLWEEGGMQPSLAGSYLAACAFYTHFYGRSPLGLSYISELDLQGARAIQAAVADEMLNKRARQ